MSISAPAPAQQLKYQPLTFDDSSSEAATPSGLAIVKVFFEGRSMERSTCACFNEDANCENRGRRQLARAHSHKAHLGAHFACSAEVIVSTKRLYSSEAPLLVGIPLAPGGVVIEVRGRTIRSQALNGQSTKVFLLLSLSALLSSLALPKYSSPM